MAEKILLTCDQRVNSKPCGHEAHTYTMHGPEGQWALDLCGKHAKPVYDGMFVKYGRVNDRDHPGRRTLSDAARPFYEDR